MTSWWGEESEQGDLWFACSILLAGFTEMCLERPIHLCHAACSTPTFCAQGTQPIFCVDGLFPLMGAKQAADRNGEGGAEICRGGYHF